MPRRQYQPLLSDARRLQSSNKLMDLFNVKTQYKGEPEYDGPLFAYRALVRAYKRERLYAMPCAGAA